MTLLTKSKTCVLVTLLISGSVLGFGGNHGKKVEPLTVLALKADMRHQLAINKGIVSDARAPVVPQVELVLTRLDDTLTTLEFRNLSSKLIKMKLFLVQADGRFVATSSCLVLELLHRSSPGRVGRQRVDVPNVQLLARTRRRTRAL